MQNDHRCRSGHRRRHGDLLRRPPASHKLEALTTTFGNTDTAIATDNALRLLELLGRPDIPVARGVERSFIHPYVRRADHVHGSNAIGDIELPEPKIRPTDEHASDLIIRMAKENPGEITLCPVGPVTNLALALVKAPEIARLLRKIVVMGSTIFHPGIHGPAAPMVDANFANDPEAAHIVLRSGADTTLVGMDVTMTTLFSTKMIDEVAREGDKAAKMLMRMTEFYLRAYKGMYPGIAGCGLHDPLAVPVAEDPSLARTERMFVDVELHGELTRGQTIADRRLTAVARHNADICMDIYRPRFLANFLPEASKFMPMPMTTGSPRKIVAPYGAIRTRGSGRLDLLATPPVNDGYLRIPAEDQRRR